MRWMLGADAKVSILSTAGLSNAAPANMVPLSDSAIPLETLERTIGEAKTSRNS